MREVTEVIKKNARVDSNNTPAKIKLERVFVRN
jgi:hypothetical protein